MGQEQSSLNGEPPAFPPGQTAPSSDEDKIDIYDTSVNPALLALLASIHEDDNEQVCWQESRHGMSATAQEFVPGKIFESSTLTPTPKPLLRTPESPAASTEKWNAAAPEFVPSKLAVEATLRKAPVVPSASNSLDRKVWYYKDPSGTTQGPFSTVDMRSWKEKGYFDANLEIARSLNGPFLPLGDVYVPTEGTFFGRIVDDSEFDLRVSHFIHKKKAVLQKQLQDQLKR